MQKFMPMFSILILALFSGQTLAGADTTPPAAAPQKKTEKGNSAATGKHWENMNRYRVWDANRKEFIYPENWLAPESDNTTTAEKLDHKPLPKKNK